MLETARRAADVAHLGLDPVSRSDREDALAFFLEDRGIAEAWDMAPALVAAGLDLRPSTELADDLPERCRRRRAAAGSRAGSTIRALVDEVRRGAERISALVQAVKDYSFMDRAPMQEVDVRDGLESTLMILRHKLGSIDDRRATTTRSCPRIAGPWLAS